LKINTLAITSFLKGLSYSIGFLEVRNSKTGSENRLTTQV